MSDKLFKVPNLTNKPSRSGFDLSHKNSFSAKIGELLPITHRHMMIGDKAKLRIQHKTVTLPLESSAFTRFTEYFDFFFVPYSQLYRNTPQILMQMQNNPQYAASINSASPIGIQLPWFNSADLVGSDFNSQRAFIPYLHFTGKDSTPPTNVNYQGFSLGYEALKLYNYIGGSYVDESWLLKSSSSPGIQSHPYSVFPWAAYQKIYFDYYRFHQWEKNAPQCYNFDYLTGNLQLTLQMMKQMNPQSNLFTLRHCNYPKDLFFGMLPSPQYDTPSIAHVSSYNITTDHQSDPTSVAQKTVNKQSVVSAGEESITTGEEVIKLGLPYVGNYDDPGTDINLGIDILELRRAKALQRYREVIGTGNQDFVSMAKKVYGEDIPKHYSNQVQYLGGFSNVIEISTVVNNNLAGDNSQPDMKGIAQGVDEQNGVINFECDTPGILMCIYRVIPLLDYALRAPHFDLLKTEVDDYPNPFFDRLGLQELPSTYLSDTTIPRTLGYVPRYFDSKTAVDVVNGVLRNEMKHWIAAFTDEYVTSWLGSSNFVSINKDFFKVNAHLVDTVFFQEATESVSSDQFLINANIDFKVVRNLDYDGLPKGN